MARGLSSVFLPFWTLCLAKAVERSFDEGTSELAAASSLREAAWGRAYPRKTVKSPVDQKEYQFYDFTESRHLAFVLPVPNIVLIRPEYDRAYNYLNHNELKSAILITGQPGIGEMRVCSSQSDMSLSMNRQDSLPCGHSHSTT